MGRGAISPCPHPAPYCSTEHACGEHACTDEHEAAGPLQYWKGGDPGRSDPSWLPMIPLRLELAAA